MIIKKNLEPLYYLKEQVKNGTHGNNVMEVEFSDNKRNILHIFDGDDTGYTPMITLSVESQEKINGRWRKIGQKDILTCHYEFFVKNCGEGLYQKIIRTLTEEP
ncbi:MAG: hypothetical protein K6A76_07075 [Oribacterium sp.]|nr:hypothetical protein [Oribacterium sp.]